MVLFVGKEVVWAEAEIVKDSNIEIPVPNFTKFMLQCLENTDCDRKCIAVGHGGGITFCLYVPLINDNYFLSVKLDVPYLLYTYSPLLFYIMTVNLSNPDD